MKLPENSAAETISKSNGRKTLGIGVMGCGGFGHFAMQHFLQNPEIKLVGITATHREAAYTAAKRFDVELFEDINEFLKIPGLDIVYISTPPFLHYEHSMLVLNAGKNVICHPVCLKACRHHCVCFKRLLVKVCSFSALFIKTVTSDWGKVSSFRRLDLRKPV